MIEHNIPMNWIIYKQVGHYAKTTGWGRIYKLSLVVSWL
jgi:hypothetical protein